MSFACAHLQVMARTSVIQATPSEIAAIDLDRALLRLDKRLLASGGDPKLLRSSYERHRASAVCLAFQVVATYSLNSKVLEYARTLLIRLEHDAHRNQTQARRGGEKPSYTRQRAMLKRLTDRMHELERISQDDANEIYGPEDGEPIVLSDEEPPPSPSSKDTNDRLVSASARPPSPQATLRNRFQPQSHTESESSPSTSPFAAPKLGHQDEAMDAAERLQSSESRSAELTTSLLSLAQQLKASSSKFQSSLSADEETLKRAGEGLDKNETQMEATRKRMGLLTRMSEGEGWWGRMMLYAWIFGLWLVALLLVFVFPKLRF